MLDEPDDKGRFVPEWLVERLVARDLPDDEAAAVRARLSACGRLERIHELELSNRVTLARHPAKSVAAEIERRLRAYDLRQEAPTVSKAPFLERIKAFFVETRAGIVRVGLTFVGGTAVAWYYRSGLLSLTIEPFAGVWQDVGSQQPALHFSSPASLFVAYLQLAVVFGAVAALPILLRELWVFVTSGVHSRARKLAAPFVASSCAMLAFGGWFLWQSLLPRAFRSQLQFALPNGTEILMQPEIMVGDYVEFVTRCLIAAGIAAQIPVLLSFLSYAGIVTPRDLIRFFRYFVVLALILAALLTPPDPLSQLLLAAALCAVYALSVGLASALGKLGLRSR